MILSNVPLSPRSVPALSALSLALFCAFAQAARVDPALLEGAAGGAEQDVLLVLDDWATPSLPPMLVDLGLRRRMLVEALQRRAAREQAPLREWLDARAVEHRDYWIVNLIEARVRPGQLAELAARGDLQRIAANPRIRAPLPAAEPEAAAARLVIPWGVERIRAPELWARGYTGQGVTIGGADTGYQWDHPALQWQYRGWSGGAVSHARNWHDAIHDEPGNPCGSDAPAPCDDHGHGTHTAGTFAGDDGGEQRIGVAPGARWIGCRNMASGWGTPARYIECMQWMLAPTDAAGLDPDPDLAPDVASNSWACVPAEGCTVGDELRVAADQLVAAGIFFVAAAGNSGPGCGSVEAPPATHDSSFVVGVTNLDDQLDAMSARGPVAGSARIRPDLVAPGIGVHSSVPGGGYASMSGTSMATPHVAGAAALLMSVNPALKGHPEQVAQLLRESAQRDGVSDPWNSGCGGLDMHDWPNHQAGYGRVDVYAAALAAGLDERIFSDGFDSD